jgi:hypothetical protein
MIDMSSTLTMGGGTVSYNTSTGSLGGGVYIGDSCTFNMTDGAITANHIDSQRVKTAGGGVAVHFGGAFNMTGGVISENYITADSGHADGIFGGGVYVSIHNSTFVLSGGVISGNAVYHANPDATSLMAGGGGVCIDSGYYSDNLLFDKQTAPAGQALIYGYGTSADNNKVFLGYVPPLPIPSPAPVRKYGSAVLVLYSTFSSGKPNTVVRIVESDVINTDVFSVLYNDNNRWTFSGTWPALNPAY